MIERYLNCLILLLVAATTTYGFVCPDGGQSHEANPMSCRMKYECENSKATLERCPDTMTFDSNFKMCRDTEVVDTCNYAPVDCYVDKGSGFDYQGTVSTTRSGDTCMEWSMSTYSVKRYKLEGNYCRNPKPETFSQPWCHTKNMQLPQQPCDIPVCKGSSVKFNGGGYLKFNTGQGGSNSTYDLQASYEEEILFYVRPQDTNTLSTVLEIKSAPDDQKFIVTIYKKVVTVYVNLEAGAPPAKANTWKNLNDGKAHKIVIKRKGSNIFLQVDDGSSHYSKLYGPTDKLMLPMKVEIGRDFKGCISSLDIITTNFNKVKRHHEPFEKLLGNSDDNQIVVEKDPEFNGDYSSGCMLAPLFSEVYKQPSMNESTVETTVSPDPEKNGTVAEVGDKTNKDLYIILAGVIGAAFLILLIVLIIVCKKKNQDKGVYKLKETKQFDWEYGNLPPTSKRSLMDQTEHGV